MSASDKTAPIDLLLDVMARLRDRERGCPWDVEQTFATIAPYTIEEAYEVAEAIAREDMGALQDELGDLLFQVVFHARMAEEAGRFAFDDVARGIVDKMVRRHPHVFADREIADREIADADAQTVHWEDVKADERAQAAQSNDGPASALDGVALGLPALLRALKLQKRAARVGFDWPDTLQVFEKIEEELAELQEEAVRPGQPGAPPEGRPGGRAAPRQRQVRAALRRRRTGLRPRPRRRLPRPHGSRLAACQGRRRLAAKYF